MSLEASSSGGVLYPLRAVTKHVLGHPASPLRLPHSKDVSRHPTSYPDYTATKAQASMASRHDIFLSHWFESSTGFLIWFKKNSFEESMAGNIINLIIKAATAGAARQKNGGNLPI